jgi:very-short-patch-repair endonuclease
MSDAEDQFAAIWRTHGPDDFPLERECRFAPPRRWRFDFANTERKVAIEIEGGAWTGGRHTRGAAFEKDAEKYNTAALLGWIVLRYTPQMVKRDPLGVVSQVATALGAEPAAA